MPRSALDVLGLLGTLTASLAATALAGCDDSATPGGESASGGMTTGGSAAGGTAGSSTGQAGGGGATGNGGSVTGGVSGVGGTAAGGSATGGTAGASSGGTAGSGTAGSESAGSGGMPGGGGGVAGGGAGGSGAAGAGGTAGNAGGAGGMAAGSGGGGNGGAGGKAPTCPAGTPSTGGMRICSNMKGNIAGGYAYELWAEGTGQGCMTVYGDDAKFSATWTAVDDFLARVGLDFDRTRTHSQIGTLSADFVLTKTESGGGLTYIGVYGWTVNPLREYYILDDWGATKPAGFASDGTPRTSVGTLTADGETYDVWKHTRVNKPAITGDNMTFDQYFSIRRTARQCGHISISQHFSQWTSLGLQLGNLVEAKLLLEAQGNSGTIEFTTATVEVD